jgi:hypothetical protein
MSSRVRSAAVFAMACAGAQPAAATDAPADKPLDSSTGEARPCRTLASRSICCSVFINEAQSNPLQPDLMYCGFTASPLLGLPQGLAQRVRDSTGGRGADVVMDIVGINPTGAEHRLRLSKIDSTEPPQWPAASTSATQELSGSNVVIAATIASVCSPMSFWNTTPSALTMKVMTPLT